jgi:hypothetical protein
MTDELGNWSAIPLYKSNLVNTIPFINITNKAERSTLILLDEKGKNFDNVCIGIFV